MLNICDIIASSGPMDLYELAAARSGIEPGALVRRVLELQAEGMVDVKAPSLLTLAFEDARRACRRQDIMVELTNKYFRQILTPPVEF